jgi:hypothetical protein
MKDMISTPNTWSQLIAMPLDSVPEFRTLRPGDNRTRQFVQGEEEYIAVHGARPYGGMEEKALGVQFLAEAQKRQDYAVFTVPQELMPLDALTLGTRTEAAYNHQLKRVYTLVSQLLGRTAALREQPRIGIDDLAYDRRNSGLYLIPPTLFHDEPLTAQMLRANFSSSMQAKMGNVLVPKIINSLSAEVMRDTHEKVS